MVGRVPERSTAVSFAVSPLRRGGKARVAGQGGLFAGENTPLLHYLQLPPYFIGSVMRRCCYFLVRRVGTSAHAG